MSTTYILKFKKELSVVKYIYFQQANYKQLLDDVFVISSWRLRLITLTETSVILDITKTESNNFFIIHWTESHVFASSLTPHSTKRATLTWLPLEIMHCGHTFTRDLECPWHDYCIMYSYDVMGADFENSLYAFGQSETR